MAVDSDPDYPETVLQQLIASGGLAAAAGEAIAAQKALGIPVTFVRGGKIIKQFADGREEELAPLSRPMSRNR